MKSFGEKCLNIVARPRSKRDLFRSIGEPPFQERLRALVQSVRDVTSVSEPTGAKTMQRQRIR